MPLYIEVGAGEMRIADDMHSSGITAVDEALLTLPKIIPLEIALFTRGSLFRFKRTPVLAGQQTENLRKAMCTYCPVFADNALISAQKGEPSRYLCFGVEVDRSRRSFFRDNLDIVAKAAAPTFSDMASPALCKQMTFTLPELLAQANAGKLNKMPNAS